MISLNQSSLSPPPDNSAPLFTLLPWIFIDSSTALNHHHFAPIYFQLFLTTHQSLPSLQLEGAGGDETALEEAAKEVSAHRATTPNGVGVSSDEHRLLPMENGG